MEELAVTYKLRIVCTGSGKHPQTLLGVLVDERERPNYSDLASLAEDLPERLGNSVRETITERQNRPAGIYYERARTRLTRRGDYRRSVRENATVVERADGGRTFHFTCPRCRKTGHKSRHVQLRDTTIASLFDKGVETYNITH